MNLAVLTMPLFFLLSILEGLAALAALFAIPSDGLSPARLALFAAILLPLTASAFLFIRSLDGDWRVRVADRLTARPNLLRALAFSSSLLFLTFGLLLFLLRYLNPEATASYFTRARPALTYLLLLAAQTSLFLTALRNGLHPQSLQTRRAVFVSAGIILALFAILWLIVIVTGLGVTKDTSYWGEPGIPILGWQLILALLVGILSSFIFHLSSFFSRSSSAQRVNFLLPFIIYLLALLLWLSVPLTSLRNSFYAPITPPYAQPFPASDAAYYDTDAQSLLAGYGFVHEIPTRPLFILFLAALHALLGQDYARLILGQTLVFALLPVALYFLGKKLHSRAAGLTVSLLVIFRELTSLWVASDARVSNTKMLLSEFITTLVLIAYLLLVIRWLQRRSDWQSDPHHAAARKSDWQSDPHHAAARKSDCQSDPHHAAARKSDYQSDPQARGSDYQSDLLAFISGGALGLQLLLRTQVAFLAPGIILLAFIAFWPNWKKWFAQSAIFALGLILAVSPWLARNYLVTGQASLDDPIQIKAVASMYSGGTPTSNFPQFEGQSPEEISQYVVSVILEKPGYVAGFVANQFFANTIDTLLVLPIFARYDGLSAPIYPYWGEWDTYLSPANILLFVLYLALISLGIAAAWKRLRWVSLLPLVFFLFYNFSTSLARYSGWRYIFPVDWVGYFYFAVGAMELVSMLAMVLGKGTQGDTYTGTQVAPSSVSRLPSPVLSPNPYLLTPIILLAVLLISSLPWIAESSIPRAQPLCADSLPACLAAHEIEESQVAAFLSGPDALALTGYSLYPRYFPRYDGLASTNPAPAFAPRDFPRMGFFLLTPDGLQHAILPMKGSRPFPHATEAILLGCQREGYIEVRLIVFPATGEAFSSASLIALCTP